MGLIRQHYEKKELTKFFEYMSAGLPVIASNFAAWVNVIERNNCGLCISPDDPEGISESIAMLQNDPERAQTMGRSRLLLAVAFRDCHPVAECDPLDGIPSGISR